MSPGRAALGGVSVGDGLSVVAVGVVNLSPESFHAGSVYTRDDDLLGAALGMVEAGAALIDVGARSTAPYLAAALDEAEERDRLVRAVELLARKLPVPISADTARPAPARAALEAGARVINDVSGLRDPAVAALVAKHHASVILMASPDRGGPGGPPVDPVEHVMGLLRAALGRARAAGIPEERIVVDPGIGFFRDEGIPWHEWDARVLAGLGGLNELGRPVCVGVSRKSFIGAITGRQRAAERLAGSLAATAIAVRNGAAVIRTHDPAETLDAIRVAERLGRAGAP
ncbi:MAG: dihydropteroate synthase [Candidatus Rokubacteria bacterium 13_1_20CM_70_15]|nr:MAG: dihydropteroate synthase [Candidatus Rokubacteria bacterium 13_1_20CM_70_15]